MDVVIALDFDGTLYPITDYDSEQMLLHLSGRDGAEELIERDRKGAVLTDIARLAGVRNQRRQTGHIWTLVDGRLSTIACG